MGIVHMSEGSVQPVSRELRSEPWIVASLASTSLERNWLEFAKNYDNIRDLMSRALQDLKITIQELE